MNKKIKKFNFCLKRGENRKKLDLKVSDQIEQFKILDIKKYPEFDMNLYFLQH